MSPQEAKQAAALIEAYDNIRLVCRKAAEVKPVKGFKRSIFITVGDLCLNGIDEAASVEIDAVTAQPILDEAARVIRTELEKLGVEIP